MCTVVVRRTPGDPVQILALRDELVGRPFDEAGEWWPAQPGVIGGRDRLAGGTWCATDVATGVTALLLNRPEKPAADPGAPSRGVLPLQALAGPTHGLPAEGFGGPVDRKLPRGGLDLRGMASFTLVVVGPEVATAWAYDGVTVSRQAIPEGTSMFTSGGLEDGRAERFLPLFTARAFPDGWFELVTAQRPDDHPGALLVRHELGEKVFATVFGQLIDAAPGRLGIRQSRTPQDASTWQESRFS